MSRRWQARRDWQLVFSCEHASPAVPCELHGLRVPQRLLQSHRGYDAGALPIAEQLAASFGAPLLVGRWSRLVVDLNRSAVHPQVIPRRVDGQAIPGNSGLSLLDRLQRLYTYWQPYREELHAVVEQALRRGPVLHLSVHSFVPELQGRRRENDIGLLYDPRRGAERAFAAAWRRPLLARGYRVRCNHPYYGHTDGVTSWLRHEYPAARYLGIELECNQRLSARAATRRQLQAALPAALAELLQRGQRP